jgi:hypothetical protein
LKLLKQYLRYISLLLLLSLILLLLANTPIVIYLHLLEASLPLSAKILFAPLRLLEYRIWIDWVEELLSMTLLDDFVSKMSWNGLLIYWFMHFWISHKLYLLVQKALEKNEAGDYFPLYGVCLGFELITMIVSEVSWFYAYVEHLEQYSRFEMLRKVEDFWHVQHIPILFFFVCLQVWLFFFFMIGQ